MNNSGKVNFMYNSLLSQGAVNESAHLNTQVAANPMININH